MQTNPKYKMSCLTILQVSDQQYITLFMLSRVNNYSVSFLKEGKIEEKNPLEPPLWFEPAITGLADYGVILQCMRK